MTRDTVTVAPGTTGATVPLRIASSKRRTFETCVITTAWTPTSTVALSTPCQTASSVTFAWGVNSVE